MRQQIDDLIHSSKEFSIQGTNRNPVETVAYYLATSNKINGPQLVVTENYEEAKKFKESFSFWTDKSIKILPTYDPHLYAGVQLSPSQIYDRISWLYSALNENESHIFVAPIMGLLQKTMPPELMLDRCIEFSVGNTIPEDFFQIMSNLGYFSVPLVEDRGSFANRGGIIDIFSPQMAHPVRIELFDDEIESIRSFDQHSQRTLGDVQQFLVIPAREVLLDEKNCLMASQKLLNFKSPDIQVLVNHLRRLEYSENLDYYLPLFYDKYSKSLDYFQSAPTVWMLQELNIETTRQQEMGLLDSLYQKDQHPLKPKDLFEDYIETRSLFQKKFSLEKVKIIESADEMQARQIDIPSKPINKPKVKKFNEQIESLKSLLDESGRKSHFVFSIRGQSQFDRISPYLKDWGYRTELLEEDFFDWDKIQFSDDFDKITFIPRKTSTSLSFPSEKLNLISFENFFGKQFQKSKKVVPRCSLEVWGAKISRF
ncbi:MAG: hypothetical protein HRT44_07265 [Bdellovibrionales bacterium]|nr:hypothetical protein [Bdellovibrionales bacterium]NQZ19036.1 hypothetical protein [Bdellovibrionales bacterium]